MKTRTLSGKSCYGGVLISALAFVTITSLMVAGIVTLAVSHYAREQTEADYVTALALAEAGVNYEFRKISANVANADQRPNGTSPGVSYTFGGGTFAVYCAKQDGTTPWVPPGTLNVMCTGTINGVSRSLLVSGKGYSITPNYAMFGVSNNQTSIINGTPTTVGGDIGTDGTFIFNGHPTISGAVDFNGAGSGWAAPPNATYTVNYLPNPVVWPTVSTIASQIVPGGNGLAGLATVNDNATATPPIVNNFVLINGAGTLTLHGKPGGANYYVTSLTMNGTASVVFDNSLGPINIWQGPAGSSSTFIFNGGIAAKTNVQDPTKKVSIYVATTNDVIMNGNTELDAGIYNYNGPANGGNVILNGSPIVNGSIIAYKFTCNGNPTVNYQTGFFQTTGAGYYGFDDQWLEIGGM
jgi:hypothetical protein